MRARVGWDGGSGSSESETVYTFRRLEQGRVRWDWGRGGGLSESETVYTFRRLERGRVRWDWGRGGGLSESEITFPLFCRLERERRGDTGGSSVILLDGSLLRERRGVGLSESDRAGTGRARRGDA
jgi:hypothetical protein